MESHRRLPHPFADQARALSLNGTDGHVKVVIAVHDCQAPGMHDGLENPPPSGIGLFDLDGTLIPWDCQVLFRHFVVRREPWRACFLPVFIAFLPLLHLLGDGGMKRVFLSYLWKMPEEDLRRHSLEFAASVAASVYPELREKIESHRRAGHLLVLASASPEFYVSEIGRELGFDLVLGTPVETGAFFPDLDNHKGAAKVERLEKILPASYFAGGKLINAHGYTDSTADLPMLALCDSATVVNPGRDLTKMAEDCGWEILRPARPWKSKSGFIIRMLALLAGSGTNPGALS
jgi:HAD superfamily hydrolase (TIGR01490 family)